MFLSEKKFSGVFFWVVGWGRGAALGELVGLGWRGRSFASFLDRFGQIGAVPANFSEILDALESSSLDLSINMMGKGWLGWFRW